jgi:tetratricopeptide (TPR) repeat protein
MSPVTLSPGLFKRAMVRSSLLLVLMLTVVYTVRAQKLTVESDTYEGQLLQQVDAEQSDAKKQELLERFAKSFPNHEAMPWVLTQIQSYQVAQKNWERVLTVGTQILSLDATEVAAAHNCLRAAEALGDLKLIRLWSDQTSKLARDVQHLPKPDDPTEVDDWKQKSEYAVQVDQYAEYALYAAALKQRDAKAKSQLIEQLESRNPASEYLALLRTSQSQALLQVDMDKAVAAADSDFIKGIYNDGLLLTAATHYMNKRIHPDRVIAYSNKVIELVTSRRKPDDLTDAEWEKKKCSMLSLAHWMAGLLYSTQGQYGHADRHLRAALPMLNNPEMLAGALYHLGHANYQLAEAGERIRIHDAVRFTAQCAGINSLVQQQAAQNLHRMKAEYNLP